MLLVLDESQIAYYEKILKSMPLKVLRGHGVLERNGELVTLATDKLTIEQKAVLRRLCEERIQRFIESRGLAVWITEWQSELVPDSIRYRVLKAANGKCVLLRSISRRCPSTC